MFFPCLLKNEAPFPNGVPADFFYRSFNSNLFTFVEQNCSRNRCHLLWISSMFTALYEKLFRSLISVLANFSFLDNCALVASSLPGIPSAGVNFWPHLRDFICKYKTIACYTTNCTRQERRQRHGQSLKLLKEQTPVVQRFCSAWVLFTGRKESTKFIFVAARHGRGEIFTSWMHREERV